VDDAAAENGAVREVGICKKIRHKRRPNMLHIADGRHSVKTPPTKTEGNGGHKRPPKATPNATEAALLAYALMHGRLNAQQACRLAGASTAYLSIVTRMSAEERDQLTRGELSLAKIVNAKRNGNGNGARTETLTEHLRRSSPAELIMAVREYGITQLFDVAFVPLLSEQGGMKVKGA
jgi:hypothetical protein